MFPHGPAVHQAETAWLATEEEVFGNRQVFQEVDLLIDGADAKRLRFGNVCRRSFRALEADRAAILGIDTGQDLDERRFSGAILSEKRVDLAALQCQVHAV